MIPLITEIIEKFGPRPAASKAEKHAQLFMRDKCLQYTENVKFMEFEEYLHARFGKLKYYCAVFFISMLLYYFSIPDILWLKITALLLSLANTIAFVLDFMTYTVVLQSFPGPLMTSWNVEATLEPKGEVKSTMIISGHIDSVFEFKWWYKLGQLGSLLTIIAGAVMVLFPVFCLMALLLPSGEWNWWVFMAFVLLSPSTVTYFNMHSNHAVDGASDNLSGIAISFEIFKTFADPSAKGKSTLHNTRLKFVSFGSEETGLSGSFNYVKAHKDELLKENAHLINIDGVRLPEHVSVVQSELMSGTKHSPMLVEGLQKSFAAKNIPIKTVTIPIGGTDAVAFARLGLPSTTIIGIAIDKLDPTYHTRRDVVGNINPLALENTKNGVVEFVSRWDEQA